MTTALVLVNVVIGVVAPGKAPGKGAGMAVLETGLCATVGPFRVWRNARRNTSSRLELAELGVGEGTSGSAAGCPHEPALVSSRIKRMVFTLFWSLRRMVCSFVEIA
jgi:hypothetical protein